MLRAASEKGMLPEAGFQDERPCDCDVGGLRVGPQLLSKPLFGLPDGPVCAPVDCAGAGDSEEAAALIIGGCEPGLLRGGRAAGVWKGGMAAWKGMAVEYFLAVAQPDLFFFADGQAGHSEPGIRRD